MSLFSHRHRQGRRKAISLLSDEVAEMTPEWRAAVGFSAARLKPELVGN
jgi:hypothetical protein